MTSALANNGIQNGAGRIFLLSPASIRGIRGSAIMRQGAKSPLALRLREEGVPLGEVFSFISGLYFRGKLAYARHFAKAPDSVEPAYIITAGAGLVASNTVVTLERLREVSVGDVDARNRRYRKALEQDARALLDLVGKNCQVVLLGSVATPKYTDPLLEIFGKQLLFPVAFAGRGDMSRGGLLLRSVSAGIELTYTSLIGGARHGPKPPRLGAPTSAGASPGMGGRLDIVPRI
jgi:hypothetical protein